MEEPLINESSGNSDSRASNDVNPTLVIGAVLTLIFTGLSIVGVTMMLPSLMFLFVLHAGLPYKIAIAVIQVFHLHQLWTNENHLAFYRWLSLPLRRFLLRIVVLIAHYDSVREGESTMYIPTDDLQLNAFAGKEKEALLMTFRQSVRRRHRQMEKLFMEKGIERRSVYSESSFNASELVPLIWIHEKRQCAENGNSVVGEFIKRFLCMVLFPDAVLDLYYDPADRSKPIAVQQSVLQGNVLHWFMYFAADSGTKSGIWFQAILLNITRAVVLPNVKYLNAQTHHESSKRNAGLLEAETTEVNILKELYPWDVSSDLIPSDITLFSGWENQSKNDSKSFPLRETSNPHG